MPILEALAAGIPSACSSIAPFEAIVGSAAARFSPDSVEAMTAAMKAVTADSGLRSRAREEGPVQAGRFDWNATARRTLEVLEKAASPDG